MVSGLQDPSRSLAFFGCQFRCRGVCRGIHSREKDGDAEATPSGSSKTGTGDSPAYSLVSSAQESCAQLSLAALREAWRARDLDLGKEECLGSHCYQLP